MRVLFMGTPDIAAECLKALVDAGIDVVGVFTQPDRPKGRGMKLTPSPVKVYATERGIPVYQPTKLKKCGDLLAEIDPELIAVAAYGRLLPKLVLDYPKYGSINMHASLLPRWRGSAPIQRCIAAGDTLGGVTTMYMAEELDAGDMILRAETPITDEDTGGSLHDRYAELGGRLLVETIRQIEAGTAPRTPQPSEGITLAPPITKEECAVDWTKGAREIFDLIRAMNPFPTAYTKYDGAPMKLYASKVGGGSGESGCVISTDGGLEVACGDGSIVITELAAAGGKRMAADAWLRGHKVEIGTKLG